MLSRYKEDQEGDLWSDYGSAYEEIRKAIVNAWPHLDIDKCRFDHAYVKWFGKEYTLSATFTVFDTEIRETVLIGCTTTAIQGKEGFKTSCGQRTAVEYDGWKKEYVPIQKN